MKDPAFQKISLPNGHTYIVMRPGVGDPAIEFNVYEKTKWGNVYKFQGTFDECMDWVTEVAVNFPPEKQLTPSQRAALEAADANFHRNLG